MSGSKRVRRIRQAVLAGLLLAVVALAALYYGRTLYYENQLETIADELVARANEDELMPFAPEGSGAELRVETTCTFEYLVFGEPSGKITLVIHPDPDRQPERVGGVSFIYAREGGEWVQRESYHE
jgi:hypothetical protein